MCPCYSLQVILYSLNGTEIRERMYENTWKSGELELYFPPSAEGLEKKKKNSLLALTLALCTFCYLVSYYMCAAESSHGRGCSCMIAPKSPWAIKLLM